MDSIKTIEDAKDMVKAFCTERDWDQFHNQKDLAIGIASEAGELLECYRFKSDKDMAEIFNTSKGDKIKEEIADVFYFTLRFAQMNNIDLYEELEKKIAKNAKKYPLTKSRGCNKKYDEYEDS